MCTRAQGLGRSKTDLMGQKRVRMLAWRGILTLTPVFLTADSVTSLLQITVPQKIVKDTKDGRASDTNVIKKSL